MMIMIVIKNYDYFASQLHFLSIMQRNEDEPIVTPNLQWWLLFEESHKHENDTNKLLMIEMFEWFRLKAEDDHMMIRSILTSI